MCATPYRDEAVWLRSSMWLTTAVVGTLLVSSASASTVMGQEGLATLNSQSAASGSFAVNVAYQLYDGTSASDPLGITGNPQLALVLDHQGLGSGNPPVAALSRFFVFAPAGQSATDFFSSASSVSGSYLVGPAGHQIDSAGGVAPHSDLGDAIYIDPDENCAGFNFTTGFLDQADLLPGQHSQLLVLEVNRAALPANVIIEVNASDNVPALHGDATITITPEPVSCLLLIAPLAMWFGRRSRKV